MPTYQKCIHTFTKRHVLDICRNTICNNQKVGNDQNFTNNRTYNQPHKGIVHNNDSEKQLLYAAMDGFQQHYFGQKTRHRRAQHDGRSHVNTAQNRQKSTVVSESGWWLPPDGVGASEDRRVSERGSLSTFYNLEYQLHRYVQF